MVRNNRAVTAVSPGIGDILGVGGVGRNGGEAGHDSALGCDRVRAGVALGLAVLQETELVGGVTPVESEPVGLRVGVGGQREGDQEGGDLKPGRCRSHPYDAL